MMRDRRERAIRERGRPATGVVRAWRRRGDGEWIVTVRVAPSDGPARDTRLRVDAIDGAAPRGGDLIEVIHHGGHAIALEEPARFRAPPAAPDTGGDGAAHPPPRAPRPEEVIAQIVRHLADGGLTGGGPQIIVDPPAHDAGPAPGAEAAHGARGEPLRRLIARAPSDPDAVADEILRRIAAGESNYTQILDATRKAGPAGSAGGRAVLDSLRERGTLSDRTHAMLSRMLG
jgi:hypothetical protein